MEDLQQKLEIDLEVKTQDQLPELMLVHQIQEIPLWICWSVSAGESIPNLVLILSIRVLLSENSSLNGALYFSYLASIFR